jgi:putative ABC transport system permease protein
VAGEIRRSYVSAGVDATTTRELLDTGRSQGRAFLLFFRLLMGMGMVVAVVSLGILALRAVVERGRAIGILRALGYQPRQVLGGMLGESSISASLGVVVGLAVGWIAWHIFVQGLHQSAPPLPEEAVLLLAIYLGVLAVTVAVTAGPALQASRLTPIEALRTVD